ncbi:hypothetical protein ALC57_07571, partial [Trachymyrmex cornetzi]
FTALTTPAAPPTNDPRTPSSGRTVRTPPRFAESRITRGNTFPRLLSEYIVSRVSFGEIVAVRIRYVVLATCSIQWINTRFLEDAREIVLERVQDAVERHGSVKVNTAFNGEFATKDVRAIKSINTKNNEIYRCTDICEWYERHVIEPTLTSLEEFQERDSGWALSRILNLTINVNKLSPMRAGCYVEVSREIVMKRVVISERTADNACFAWSVVAALYPAERNVGRESSYPHYTTVLNLAGIEFPIMFKDINKFERLNAMSINVYGIKNKQVLPLRLTSDKKEKHINLLYLQDPRDNNVGHFAWIKNLSRLVRSQVTRMEHKKFFCDRKDCGKINDCAIRLPSEDDRWLELSNHCNQERVPFVVKNCIKLRFIDSFKFLSASLDKMASYLDKDKLKIIIQGQNFLILAWKISIYSRVKVYFHNLSMEDFDLLTRKGVYPYEYIDCIEKLEETELPPRESFYSSLTGDTVSEGDYAHAVNVWQRFSIRTLGEYSDLYLKTDVLLLADIFENSTGYILEVDLEYPERLHDEHVDLSFCPTRDKPPGKRQNKLLATVYDKKRYVIHYRNLQQCTRHGLRVTKIHRVLQFAQSACLRDYIELNTNFRTHAKNDFEKNLYKLMNNAVFGKTMENVRNHVDVKLLTKWDGRYGAEAMIAKPNFHSRSVFEENLIAVELRKLEVKFNKPIYVDMCILDISKVCLYEFHYDYMLPLFHDKCKIMYTDTDSLIYRIECENIYKTMKRNIARFDTSDYPADNAYGMSLANKKVPGLMKDENNGMIMTEFFGLRAKMYALKVDGKKDTKRRKV